MVVGGNRGGLVLKPAPGKTGGPEKSPARSARLWEQRARVKALVRNPGAAVPRRRSAEPRYEPRRRPGVPRGCWGTALVLLGLVLSAGAAAEKNGVRALPLQPPPPGKPGFTLLAPDQTGVGFTNRLWPEAEARNHNLLNGSGVALGDYDGDGWCDVFLCSLNGASTLYRNLGGWRFADVTVAAGLANTNQLARGAVFADVDGDGDPDLLVSYSGAGVRLFLNDGRGRFQEAGAPELRAETGSMTLALGDVDGDGDLDLYVTNYGENTVRSGLRISTRLEGGREVVVGRYRQRLRIIDGKLVEYGEPDALYLNEGAGRFRRVPWTGGAFRDETGQTLRTELWDMGLTAVIRDLNQDGHPDLYVCNDFHNPERVWLGDGRGGFQLAPRPTLRSTMYFSMAVDFGDFNRDGLMDFFGTDMLSRHHTLRMRQQRLPSPPLAYTLEPQADRPQVQRNMLFINRGDGTYTEMAQRAGVAASDWTWSVLCLDVDLDGWDDLLVGTGHYFDALDQDAIERTARFTFAEKLDGRRMLDAFPPLRVPNYAFRNRGDLTFEEVGRRWGFDATEVSHGMAAADLDNDGDLDVVVNCLRGPALVYRNDATAPRLAVRLRGRPPNTRGIGARLRLSGGPLPVQVREMTCGGLYLAGSDTCRVFATGTAEAALVLEVFWRSGRYSRIPGVRAGFLYEIDEAAAEPQPPPAEPAARDQPTWFLDESAALNHTHQDAPYDDFGRQPLLPRRFSTAGPGVAWLDVDADGREDLFIGGGRGSRVAGFRNLGAGRFAPLAGESPPDPLPDDATGLCGTPLPGGRAGLIYGVSGYEAGGDHAPALRLVEFPPATTAGNTSRVGLALPPLPTGGTVGPVCLADWDGDGDLDAFVGAQMRPGRYPEFGDSVLLRNEAGRLVVDREASQPVRRAGLVNSAVFTDLDGDGWPDLALAVEWGPVRVYRNEGGRFREVTRELGLEPWTGWWLSVTAGDFDGDGRPDLVAGNRGENSFHQVLGPGPWSLYHGDLVGDGGVHLVEAWWDEHTRRDLPVRGLSDLEKELLWLRTRFPTHAAFADAGVAELLAGRAAARLEVRQPASRVFLNRGARFEARPLPLEAQLAPAFGLVVADFDGDGHEDLFVAQNFFGTRPEDGPLDAGRGLLLHGDGTGGFTPVPGTESGLVIYGEQRGAATADYDGDGRPDLVVTQHGNTTRLFRNQAGRPGLRVRLRGPPANPAGVGAAVWLEWENGGRGPAREIRAGGGWWSQDAFTVVLATPERPRTLHVRWPGGRVTTRALGREAREMEVTWE